jgi:hypothetical protein
LLIRNQEFETLKKQCWSYLRNIRTAINYFFFKRFAKNLAIFLLSKNLAEHWDLPITGIFYSKDVASELSDHVTGTGTRTVDQYKAVSGSLDPCVEKDGPNYITKDAT